MHKNPGKSGFVFSIGLTGHRDIRDESIADLRATLRKELVAIKERFVTLPVELVTGLAEGADTLATEVALEIGLPVRAVLPMPRSLYETDFSGEAHANLLKLINDSRITVDELPLPPGMLDSDFQDEESRTVCYEQLMDYLVRRSNVLIALWDGETNGRTGGTSDVLVRYLSSTESTASSTGAFEVIDDADLAVDQSDLVVWVKTTRQSSENRSEKTEISYLVQAGANGLVCKLAQIPVAITDRWGEFDQYAYERNSSVGSDVTVYPISTPQDASVDTITALIDEEFVRADQLAMANQSQSDRLFKLFGLMAATMGLTFLLYAKIAALSWFLITYVMLFLGGFILFSVSAKRGWFGRHLAFRALAEALRIRFFLVLSGGGDAGPTRRMFQLTGIDRFKGFGWIGDAIRCTEPLTYESDVPLKERVSSTSERWIKDQAAYFSRKHHHLHHQHEQLEIVKKGLFFASFIGAVTLLFFKKTLYGFHISDIDGKTLVVFFMGLLPLWLAIWEIYQTKMATRELFWQYANQGELFELAERRLAKISDPIHAQRVIVELAERSLMDVIQWSTHRYHREHEPPSAG
ncbi:MAG: hypothetical protein ACRBB6_07510 [Neptuniibacter sp.]